MRDNDKTPVVSVVVLTYNNFENIENNIRSIQNQNYENIEIIVHDDCSEDFPLEKITNLLWSKKTKYGYRIEQNVTNVGTVKNYNRAIEIARGDIIVPLAQDDSFCNASSVREIVDCFVENDCCVCTGNRIGELSGNRYPRNKDVKLIESGNDKNILLRIMIRNFISGSTLYIMRTRFPDKWKPLFDESYLLLEDYPFVFRCLKNNFHIGYINKDLIIYGEKGVSGTAGRISTKLLKDEVYFFNNEIVPSLGLIRSGIARKYIMYKGLKLDYELSRRSSKKHNKGIILLRNIDLAVVALILNLVELIGCDRYDLIFRLEERAEKKVRHLPIPPN